MAGDSPPLAPQNPVVLGAITRPHGLRGEIAIRIFNPESGLLTPGVDVWVLSPSGVGRWMEIVEVARSRLKLKGLASRDDAEALRGSELMIDRSKLPPLQAGESYLHDVIGYRVVDVKGKDIGTFRGVQVSGSREYFVIDGAREVMLPADAPVVQAVDVGRRTVRLAVEVDVGESAQDAGEGE